MADITLSRPQAGQHIVLESVPDSRLVLQFPTDQATMERTGDNLVFSFEDGSKIELANFYTQYSQESMPDFEVDGTLVAGADFFNAFGPDLMPAAGPAAGAAARAARYNEFGNSDLLDGINHLNELDWGMNLDRPYTEDVDALGVVSPDGDEVNVAPVISISGAINVVETGVFVGGNDYKEGVPTAGGQVNAYDPNGDALHFAFVASDGSLVTSITTDYGTITINPDGSYTYVLDNDKANGLAEGQTVSEDFTVQVSDGRGGVTEATITVNVTGTNDIPSLELTRDELFVDVDGTPDMTGNITDGGTALGDDPDAGHDLHYSFGTDADGNPILSITDDYGTLTIDPDSGDYTYTLDRNSDAVKVLKGDGTDDVIQHVTVVVTDEYGAHAERPLEVVIRGANDDPVITEVGKGALGVVESGVVGAEMTPVDGVMNDGGSFTVFDKDANDAQTLSVVIDGLDPSEYNVSTSSDGVTTVTTEYGVLTITPVIVTDANGSTTTTYTYIFNLYDENNPGYGDAAGKLNEGQSVDLPFRLTVTDGAGASVQQDVKVTITGTNDAPDLSLSNTNMVVSEDGVGQGTHTVLDDDADGALAGGKTVNHKFSIEHRPGENDDASIDSSVPSADFGDDAVFETKYGTLTVKADGTYTFEPSAAAQHLGAGDDVTLHFDITVTDRHDAHDTESITVTLKGANDDPTGDVQRGSLVLKESGVGDKTETGINDGWAEGPNQARIDGISEADGQFKVHEVDTNDALTLTVKDANGNEVTLTRDPGTGELYVKDAYGTLFVTETTINNPDGSHDTTYSYRYELDNDAVNGLKQYDETDGATHVEGEDHYSGKYTLSVSDGRPGSTPAEHEVDILIKGTNDQPKVEYSKVHAKEEGVSMGKDGDGNTATTDDGKDNGYVFPDHHRVEVSGHVNVSDPDQDGGFGLSVKLGDEFAGKDVTHYQGEGSSATPFVDASGNAFTSNITVDPAGSSETDNVQVIKTNYGTLTFHKQDWTETLGDGSTVYHKAGDYTFALDGDAAQSLAKGEKLDFHFTVTATDEHGSQGHHMIGVTIEGTNDVPILSLDHTALVVREAGVDVDASQSKDSGTATGTDDDHNATQSYGFTLGDAPDAKVYTTLYMDKDGHLQTSDNIDTCVGKLVMEPGGGYHFELFNDRPVVQGMNNGDFINSADTVNVRVTDEHGAYAQEPITIRVDGTNDAPTASASDLTVREDGVFNGNAPTVDGGTVNGRHQFEASGQIKVSDVDDKITGTNGHVAAEDGFTFKFVDATHTQVAKDGLSAQHLLSSGGDYTAVLGQIRSDTFPPDQLDALNAAIKAAAADGSLAVSDALKALIQAPGFDISTLSDANAKGILSHISLGTLTLDPQTGEYTFTMAASGSVGDIINNMFGANYYSGRTFKVEVSDPHGGTKVVEVVVKIQGTNDRPELVLDQNADHDVTDQTDTIATGSLAALDPDAKDSHNYYIVQKDAAGNDVTVNGEHLNEGNSGFWSSAGNIIDSGANGNVAATVVGKYGTLTITKDTDGNPIYKYELDHNKVSDWSAQDSADETFSIVVKDSGGAFDIKDVTFTVTGTDDGPKLTVVTADAHALEVKEEGVIPGGNVDNNADGSASGNFNVEWTDANASGEQNQHYGFMLDGKLLSAVDGDGSNPVTTVGVANGHSYSITGTGEGAGCSLEITIDGIHYGTLSIDADGKFTFKMDQDALNFKDENWHAKLSDFLGDNFRLVAWDDRHDAFTDGKLTDPDMVADQKLEVYLDGANDRPVFVQEGADNATLDATHTAEDGSSLPLWVAGENGVSFKEDSASGGISGNLAGSDAEGDSFTYAIVKPDGTLVQKIEGKYGILELRPDGSYIYTLTVPKSTFDHLNADQLLTDEGFNIRITDEHGASTNGKFQINFQGEHDDFKLGADNLSVTENGGALSRDEGFTDSQSKSSSVAGVDQQDKDAIARGEVEWNLKGGTDGKDGTVVVEGAYGKLVLDPATGKYHYELDNSKIQDWNSEGSNAKSDTEHFTIQAVINGQTVEKEISVTVNGANDRPEWTKGTDDFTGVAKPFVKDTDHTDEIKPDMRFEGSVSGGTDIDDNDNSLQYMLTDGSKQVNGDFSTSTVIKTDYGSFIIDPVTGEYIYTVDSYSSKLADYFRDNPDKDTFTDTIKVVVVDPHGAQSETTREIQITIDKNDWIGGGGSGPEYVDGDLAGAVVEDGDSDQDDTTHESVSGQLNANVDASDSSVFFGVQGANGQTQTGMIDHPEPVDGKYGYITVDPATGKWTYTLFNGENGSDNPVQNLHEGQTVEEEFTVMLNGKVVTTDGKEPAEDGSNVVKITITITGTNDAPEITHFDASKTIHGVEGGVLSAEGTIIATDVDRDDAGKMEDLTAHFDNGTDTMVGKYGTITLVEGENGKWTYTYKLDPAKLEADPEASKYFYKDADGKWHLIAGTDLNDKFTVHVTDGTATVDQEITIKIDGQNFAPERDASVGSVNGTGVTEDGFPVGSNTVESVIAKGDLAAAFTDDQGTGNLHFVFANGKTFMEDPNGYGTWQIDNDGNVVFTLNNESAAVQGLSQADNPTATVKVYAVDGHNVTSAEGVDVNVSIQGTADKPQLIIDKTLTVTEASDTAGTAEGTFYVIDPDAADSRDNLTYTITGPKDGGSETVSAENGGLLTFTNDYGTLTLDPATGKYSFALNSGNDAVRAMKPGELYEITFDVTVKDHDGLEGSGQIVVNIKGTNTAPDIDVNASRTGNTVDTPLVEGATGDDARFGGNIVANDVDADAGDKLTYRFSLTDEQKAEGWTLNADGTVLTTTYGTVTIDADGNYTYTLDNGRAAVLAQDQTAQEVFQVTATDKYGAKSDPVDVTINIVGTNDAPVIDSATGKNNAGTLAFSDADATDTHSLSIVVNGHEYPVTGNSVDIEGVGRFELSPKDADGKVWSWKFTADPKITQNMRTDESTDVNFQFKVSDGREDATSGNLKATITGANARPQIGQAALVLGLTGLVPDADFSISSDDANANPADNSLPLNDVKLDGQDHGDPLTYHFEQIDGSGDVQGAFGTLHFDAATGQYHYTLDTSSENLLKLAEAHANGEELKESFNYTVSDGHWTDTHGSVEVSLDAPSPGAGGSLGDEHAQDAQVVFGGEGAESLHGGSGDDILSGGAGDDYLFGGDGNDYLFGGAGNDYLDGGAGTNHLYGGDGNDILVYNGQTGSTYDGGAGMDVLLVQGEQNMDSLFQSGGLDQNVTNVEVIISGEDVLNLTNMDALSGIGITLGDNRVDLGEGWSKTDGAPEGYDAYSNGGVTITVGSDVHVNTMQEQTDQAATQIQVENS